MIFEITFSQLKKFFEHVLGIKLKRDLHVDWMQTIPYFSSGKKQKYVWHCHAVMVDMRGNEISELELNSDNLPKRFTQSELKKYYVEQWIDEKISYQWQYFSGNEVEYALRNKSRYMKTMSQHYFETLIARLRIKDNCKKLKEYDGLSESELKMKLIIMGIL